MSPFSCDFTITERLYIMLLSCAKNFIYPFCKIQWYPKLISGVDIDDKSVKSQYTAISFVLNRHTVPQTKQVSYFD